MADTSSLPLAPGPRPLQSPADSLAVTSPTVPSRRVGWGLSLLAVLGLLAMLRGGSPGPSGSQPAPLVLLPAGVDPGATSGAASSTPTQPLPGSSTALVPRTSTLPADAPISRADGPPSGQGAALLLPDQQGFRGFPGCLSQGRDPQGSYLGAIKAYVMQHPDMLLQKRSFNSEVDIIPSLDVLGIRPQDVVLDLGCGLGALEMRLLRERRPFERLYAVDQERCCVDFLACALGVVPAPERARIQASACDQGRLELPDASVDLVVLFNTPVGVAYPSTQWPPSSVGASARNLADVYRVLKPQGRVYLRLNQAVAPAQVIADNYARAGFQMVSQEREEEHIVTRFVRR